MLTDTAIKAGIRAAKVAGKPLKRYDTKGLVILCKPNGAALWRFKYILHNAEKGISLGQYPDVPLTLARDRRDDARKLVADGKDPSAERKAEKIAKSHSVESIAREWLVLQEASVSAGTLRRDRRRLETFVLPYIGKRPITTVTAPELLEVLRRIENRGHRETAHRTLSVCVRVWAYALATGRVERNTGNMVSDLEDTLKPTVVTNMAAITDPRKFGELLNAIDGYVGTPTVCAALRLIPLLFARPGEIRRMEWAELDLDAEHPVWRIPKEKTKMRDAHVVPLASQAVAILREIALHTANSKFVFPSARGGNRPMSENAINVALKNLGFDGGTHVAHGFRSSASTMLNELGWNADVIEMQLAHKQRGVRAVYNRSVLMPERRKMMLAWADHCDVLRSGDRKVVAIKRHA
jgi:integrase